MAFLRIFLLFTFCQINLFSQEMTPTRALQELIAGNQRFMNDKPLHVDHTTERRKETMEKQTPFATILGCSDSRVPPEIVFDQGLGDLFIVRVAGNVLDAVGLDSVEFSCLYLKSSFIMVLGHENCGAVSAVLEGQTQDIEAVAELIEPAVRGVDEMQGDKLENAIKANVKSVVAQLQESEVLTRLIKEKKVAIIGGYYNFHTGKVELLKDSYIQ
jgi:carbonic anhydrase